MNIQQFRFVRETVRQHFNLTEVAKVLHTSQPGVSKAILELEDELQVKIFERHGKRIKGLTKPGIAVTQVVENILLEVENLKKISDDYAKKNEGSLVIACTHTQARYALPKVIPRFCELFPKVNVSLVQGSPDHLAQMVLNNQADIAIATESLATTPGLVTLPCYSWEHMLIMPPDHPLADRVFSASQQITLKDIVEYPIITYEPKFAGRRTINHVFEEHELTPNIVLEAIDADVIKTYVELNMGIGLIAGVAFDPRRDRQLLGIPVGHLFGVHTTWVAIKAGAFVRDYVYRLLELLSPKLNQDVIDSLLDG